MVAAVMPGMAQQTKYSVSGISSDNGSVVYLTNQNNMVLIDSTTVAEGKFAFAGAVDKDALLTVRLKNADWQTPFFNDGTPITINLNDSTLKGSALNEKLNAYDRQMNEPLARFRAKLAGMTKEEKEAHEEELNNEVKKIFDDETAFVNKIFVDERNTLIPVAFAEEFFYENGLRAYDKLVAEKVAFASHPALKQAREIVAFTAEMPNVLDAYNKYHAKGFEVVGVSFDNKKEAWVKGIEQLKLPWLQISDLKGWGCAAASIYNIDGIPDNILIDPQGKITDRALRGKALQSRLQEIFGE